MVERLMILRSDTFDDDNENQMSKSHSFNTEDDDESLPLPDSAQQLENNSDTSKVDEISLKHRLKPNLSTMQSASIDTLNDQDSLAGDVSADKVKKKRRRPTEHGSTSGRKKSIDKSRIWLWLPKIDLTKPLLFLAIIFLGYIMWIKKDIWIPRLLTSTTRIHRTAIMVEQKGKEKSDSPQTSSSKDSSTISSNQEDSIDNEKNSNNNLINDRTSTSNDDDSPTPSTKSATHAKLNVRTRRNKMSFSKDRPKKKNRRLHRHVINDDDDDYDDDNDDDDKNNEIEVDNLDTINPTKGKEPILESSIYSSKKHHHNNHRVRRRKNHHEAVIKIGNASKVNAVLASHDDIIQQLQKLVKSRGRHRDFVSTFAKQSGLKKDKLNKFIREKDFSVISLERLISFLNLYHSTLLIVSK